MRNEHGPLPTLLGVLTLLTGFIDAVTFLKYDHVLVGNMTGNVVFLGFGVGGEKSISIGGTLLALAGFLLGAMAGGWLNERWASHRANLLKRASAATFFLLVCATGAAAGGAAFFVVIPLLGLMMGIQNAVARKLAIPDMTTTVLTMTLTGIMADSSLVGGTNPRLGRRLAAVVTMFVGALCGAALALNAGIAPTLATAAVIVGVVGIATHLLGRENPAWVAAT